MHKTRLILHLIGQFLLGLGLGTGWAHQATRYPALVGTLFLITGGLSILAALFGSLGKQQGP